MSEPFISEIKIFPFNFAPRQWTLCAGQLLQISEFQAVFALIGDTYGGDARTTMGVPDLRSRIPMGMGQGLGLSYRPLGLMSGREEVTLQTPQMPSHSHDAVFTPTGGAAGGGVAVETTLEVSTAQATDQTASEGDYLAAGTDASRAEAKIYVGAASKGSTVKLGGISSTATGGGGITGGDVAIGQTGGTYPVQLENPFLALNFSMALNGLFPSRN